MSFREIHQRFVALVLCAHRSFRLFIPCASAGLLAAYLANCPVVCHHPNRSTLSYHFPLQIGWVPLSSDSEYIITTDHILPVYNPERQMGSRG